MIKLYTTIDMPKLRFGICPQDRTMVLGSCFADEIGSRMSRGSFDVCVNPFGTLYNPASIAKAVKLLESDKLFSEEDCEQMGAGSTKFCSFYHHTSFARDNADDFLKNANEKLLEARSFWRSANKVIITLGTAFVWEHESYGVVANCLKRNALEFKHRMMGVDECEACIKEILCCEGKDFLFSVSPIRHLSQGAHSNTLSKSLLHLALANCLAENPHADYFPAYEILCDELRDYRFYGEDLVHPATPAIDIIWERFLDSAVPKPWHEKIHRAEKESRSLSHKSHELTGRFL